MDLSPSLTYWFIIAPVYIHTSPNGFCKSERLGRTSTVHLTTHLKNFSKKISQSTRDSNNKPRDIDCFSDDNTLMITFRPPKSVIQDDGVKRYYVEISNYTNTNIRTTYVTDQTSVYLPYLDGANWHRVRVGFSAPANTWISYSEFKMCTADRKGM